MDDVSITRVTAFTVATGPYRAFWRQLCMDADRYLFPGLDLCMTVFTDSVSACEEVGSDLGRARVQAVSIPSLGWPEATLLRYELIAQSAVTDPSAICLHLDADLRIIRPVGPELSPGSWRNGIALVRHPGFDPTNRRIQTFLASPRRILSETQARAANGGGWGTWESRGTSQAYVPRHLRRTYVCGGVWLGWAPEFLDLVEVLAERTRKDRVNGITAAWHDESHLNWYAATHETELLDSRYCWDAQLSFVDEAEAKITVVDKGREWKRH